MKLLYMEDVEINDEIEIKMGFRGRTIKNGLL